LTDANNVDHKAIKERIEAEQEPKFREVKLKLPVKMAAEFARAKIRGNMFLVVSYTTNHGKNKTSRSYRLDYSMEEAVFTCEAIKQQLIKELDL